MRNFRLLADAEFFNSRISRIDGSGDLGEQIVKVIQAKTVSSSAPPPPPQSTEAPSPTTTTEEKKELTEQKDTAVAEDGEKKEEVKA
jgi:vacuolar protein sorting-associated protein 54